MSVKAPFLIVETGQPVRSMRRYGGFPHWIRVAAGLEAAEYVPNPELEARYGFAPLSEDTPSA